MKERILTLSIILVLIIILAVLGFIFLWRKLVLDYNQSLTKSNVLVEQLKVKQAEKKNTPTDRIELDPSIMDIDTSNWLGYKNKGYGFEFKYPKYYESDKDYQIWTASNENIGLLLEWGVNGGQWNIFSIKVYPLENKNEVIQTYDFEIYPEQFELNGKILNKAKRYSCVFENNKYFYIMSTFPDNEQQYKEYKQILSTLKFY